MGFADLMDKTIQNRHRKIKFEIKNFNFKF